MKGITNHLDAIENYVSLPDNFIRRVLGDPECTVEQASYNAIALEQDREATPDYEALVRQQRELKERLAKVERLLEAHDALRVLETAT